MKKIILYSSNQIKKVPLTGGIRRFMELATSLGDHCDLTVMTGDESLELPTNVRHISTNQIQQASSEKDLAFHNIRYLKKLKKEGYDWIISFDVPPAVWLSLFRIPHLCLMVRKDLLGYERITLDSQNVHGLKRWLILKAFTLAETITMLHAEKIIVQCEYDKREIVKRHSLFGQMVGKKIFVQINNVNPSWVKASVIERETNYRKFRIGSVNGFSDYRKGCDIFLQAVSDLIDEGYDIEAFIAGDGVLLDEFRRKFKEHEEIHFLGRISNPIDFIKQLDLAVVPSRADSCPNTIMEALYNDVPVIGSNAGGIPEILRNRDAMFNLNADSLKERIIFYMNPLRREQLLIHQNSVKKQLSFDWNKKIYTMIVGE